MRTSSDRLNVVVTQLLELARIVLSAIYRAEALALLSVQANLRIIGNALFGMAGRDLGAHWGWACLVLTAAGLGCLAVLRARVRAVEIPEGGQLINVATLDAQGIAHPRRFGLACHLGVLLDIDLATRDQQHRQTQ